MKKILVYVDEGAGPRSVRLLIKSLKESPYHALLSIERADRNKLLYSDWEKEASALIFPGGRDIFYHKALQGEGNRRIREFVTNGGGYLGLCAGGYYGCGAIEFEKGHPLEVIEERELKFFPGLAAGSAYGPREFRYEDESGSRVAHIVWQDELPELKTCPVYFNGGCRFVDAASYANTKVLACYGDIEGHPAAIVECQFGKGCAVLSGVHPEYALEQLLSMDEIPKKHLPELTQGEHSRRKLFHSLLERIL